MMMVKMTMMIHYYDNDGDVEHGDDDVDHDDDDYYDD